MSSDDKIGSLFVHLHQQQAGKYRTLLLAYLQI